MRSFRLLSACLLLLVPVVAFADANPIFIFCSSLPGCPAAPDGFSEYFSDVLVVLLRLSITYVPIFGVLLIMVGGAYILLSAGSSERVEKGKKTIIWAIIGLFVYSWASTFVYKVLDPEARSIQKRKILDPIFSLGTGLQDTIFGLLSMALLGVAVYCGMWMVLSMGKEEEFKKATMGLFWAALGAIIINLADAIASAFLTL